MPKIHSDHAHPVPLGGGHQTVRRVSHGLSLSATRALNLALVIQPMRTADPVLAQVAHSLQVRCLAAAGRRQRNLRATHSPLWRKAEPRSRVHAHTSMGEPSCP